MAEPMLEMRHITKTFPGVVANEDVSLQIGKGEIHALLGENGAGKSTLMNVLAGLYRQDSGEIYLRGKKLDIHSPRDALRNRIGMIHQHFKLVGAFTVMENIMLGDRRVPVFFRRRRMEKNVADLARRYNMPVDPQARIWQLSVGEQQRVEILKTLYRDVDILILDEPTAVLTPQEAISLFDTLREMARQGCTIIIITHKLVEVVEFAHRVTVMRKGRLVQTLDEDQINFATLSHMMIGDEQVDRAPHGRQLPVGQPVLTVRNLTALSDKGIKALDDVSFEIRSGEILGVAGVAGNGQRELGEVLAGLRRAQGGVITLDGKDITNTGPRTVQKAGLGLVPEDRLGMGLVGNMNVADNLILRDYYRGRGALISYGGLGERVRRTIEQYGIVLADEKAPVRLMSGGNLQKLLLAREISMGPKVLVMAYPVRGLDIGAAEHVYRLMLEQREKGCGILFISEDVDVLLKYADRIMVFYRGAVTGTVAADSAKIMEIGLMMMGTTLEKEARHEVFDHF